MTVRELREQLDDLIQQGYETLDVVTAPARSGDDEPITEVLVLQVSRSGTMFVLLR